MFLAKCHKSVIAHNTFVEKGNAGPCNGSPFLYLFLQEILGSKYHLRCTNLLKIDLSNLYVIVSIVALNIAAKNTNNSDNIF